MPTVPFTFSIELIRLTFLSKIIPRLLKQLSFSIFASLIVKSVENLTEFFHQKKQFLIFSVLKVNLLHAKQN